MPDQSILSIFNKINLKKECIKLAHVVADAVEIARPHLEARKHRLTVSQPPEPIWLEADSTRMAQVVSNLLSRATGPLNPSFIKETIVRKQPDFDERDHGFSCTSQTSGNHTRRVTYRGAASFVVVEAETRDMNFWVLVGPLADGALPITPGRFVQR